MVWLHADHSSTTPAHSPTSAKSCTAPSPSAVGVYLERLTVSPSLSPPAPASDTAVSPTGGGSGGSSPRDGSRESSAGAGEGTSSPKARAQRSGRRSPPETRTVTKDVELDGLSAYTKESTADWVVMSPGGKGEEGEDPCVRRRIGLSPPGQCGLRYERMSRYATNPLGRREKGYLRPPDSGYNTAAVFILRPLKVRGNLTIHEGIAAQTVQVSMADSGRPATAGSSEGPDVGKPPARVDDTDSSGGQAKEPPPLAAVFLDVEALTLQVNVSQYALLNEAISALLMSQRRFRFRTMRPTTSVLEDPGAWWLYAIRYFSPISTRENNKTGGSIVLRVKVMSFEYNTSPHTVCVIPTPRTRERL